MSMVSMVSIDRWFVSANDNDIDNVDVEGDFYGCDGRMMQTAKHFMARLPPSPPPPAVPTASSGTLASRSTPSAAR